MAFERRRKPNTPAQRAQLRRDAKALEKDVRERMELGLARCQARRAAAAPVAPAPAAT